MTVATKDGHVSKTKTPSNIDNSLTNSSYPVTHSTSVLFENYQSYAIVYSLIDSGLSKLSVCLLDSP